MRGASCRTSSTRPSPRGDRAPGSRIASRSGGASPSRRACASTTARSTGAPTWSPRLAATLTLDDATRLRGAVGKYTQSPGYDKLVQSDSFVDLSNTGKLDLPNERSLHASLSFERDLAPGIEARAEVYYKSFRNLIVGRLESEAERAARVAQYDFPPELAQDIPFAARDHEHARRRRARDAPTASTSTCRSDPLQRHAARGLGVLHLRRRQPGHVRTQVRLRLRSASCPEPRRELPRHGLARRRHDPARVLGLPDDAGASGSASRPRRTRWTRTTTGTRPSSSPSAIPRGTSSTRPTAAASPT